MKYFLTEMNYTEKYTITGSTEDAEKLSEAMTKQFGFLQDFKIIKEEIFETEEELNEAVKKLEEAEATPPKHMQH